MKTRVIQDQPEQPGSNGKAPVDLASAQMQRAMNVAGRMGAWSAAHWKTAVFGWLACVVVFFYVGNALIGLKQIDLNDPLMGELSIAIHDFVLDGKKIAGTERKEEPKPAPPAAPPKDAKPPTPTAPR